ncbi:MAG: Rrf2 family transcriptional regulator [Acidobacteriota bacterium]|nr:Rrf2 family transcriptional regulator [Acidobacteriota bacterium]
MFLTRAADYGIRVMIHLARLPAGERAALPTLAKAAEVPKSFLSKVLQSLTRAGLILSYRGNDGGFIILPAGQRATLRTVIEAIDGPLFLNLCLTSGRACSRSKQCPAHPLWIEAQQQVLAVLEHRDISQIASTSETLPVAIKRAKPSAKTVI